MELFARHEGDLRAFARSLMPSWHDADEVVQQVALVAWRKFDQTFSMIYGPVTKSSS